MSEYPGGDLNPHVSETLAAIQDLTDAVDRMHSQLKTEMGMNPSDLAALRMLAIRERHGQTVTPAQIAHHLGISTASVTALLERLDRRGHIRSEAHPEDRRSRTVALTPHANAAFFEHFGSRLLGMRETAERYSSEELRVITRFLDDLTETLGTDLR